MNQKSRTSKDVADKLVKNIWCKTRRLYSSEKKIRIMLAGFRSGETILAQADF